MSIQIVVSHTSFHFLPSRINTNPGKVVTISEQGEIERTMPMPHSSNQIWSMLADEERGYLYVGSKLRIVELDPMAYYFSRRTIFLNAGIEGSAVSSALCLNYLYFGTADGKILIVSRDRFTIVVSFWRRGGIKYARNELELSKIPHNRRTRSPSRIRATLQASRFFSAILPSCLPFLLARPREHGSTWGHDWWSQRGCGMAQGEKAPCIFTGSLTTFLSSS